MNLIIDANILIAATIKDSVIRKIIIESSHSFFAPEEIISEIEKYFDLISRKNNLTVEENKKVFEILLKKITLFSAKQYSQKFTGAENIIGKIDKNDIPYVALALSFQNDGIWTEDKHFEQQNKIKVWKTKDLVKE